DGLCARVCPCPPDSARPRRQLRRDRPRHRDPPRRAHGRMGVAGVRGRCTLAPGGERAGQHQLAPDRRVSSAARPPPARRRAVGPEVTGFEPGERVVYTGPLGAYAEQAAVPAWRLVRVPRGIDARTAAAAMLQGMTAHYLSHSTYPLKAGDTALVHAAAGGVGLLLVQMAKMRGARVIGTVSTEAKARLARDAGADEVIDYTQADFEAEVRRLTGGRGVQVVYDSVGKTTFDKSLNCLAPRGYLVLFGQASGP